MSDPLSSNDGQDGDAGDEYEGDYGSLEDRIYNSRRPPSDEEVQHTVRIENWQISQVEIITTTINTSKAEVLAKSYIHGLSEVRDEITLDRLQRVSELRTEFLKLLMNGESTEVDEGKHHSALQDSEIDLKVKMGDGSTRTVGVPIPRSVMSEVKDSFLDKMSMSGGFHRLCITAGLSDSESSTDTTEEYKVEMFDTMEDALEKSEEMVESSVADYVATISFEWHHHDVDKDKVEQIQNMVDKMNTRHKEKAAHFLETMDRFNTDE